MASDNLDPNVPTEADDEGRSAFRFAPTPETAEQYLQRKRELSEREKSISRTAGRVYLAAKLFTAFWAFCVLAAVCLVGAGIYTVVHFVAKAW